MKRIRKVCSILLAVALTISPVFSVYAEDGDVVEIVQETAQETPAESVQFPSAVKMLIRRHLVNTNTITVALQ